MFHLNSSLHAGSASWDTTYARTYLQISEDQLEKINKIPGWSKTDAFEKVVTENALENIEKQQSQQASTSKEKIPTTNANFTPKDNNLRTENGNSDLQSKEKPSASTKKEEFLAKFSLSSVKETPLAPPTKKEVFLKKISLSSIKKQDITTHTLQRASSLPDLFDNDCIKKPYSVFLSGDCINYDRLLTSSCSLEKNSNRLSKQKKLETLDDSILNSIHLKDIENSVAVPLSSKGAIKITLQQEMNALGKKLLLLEKRMSPCKEMNSSPSNVKLLNVENLNCNKDLKLSQNLPSASEVTTAVPTSDSGENVDVIEIKNHKSFESQSNSHSLNEKFDAPKIPCETVKDDTGNSPKTTICNFESFVSPPVPCAQPATEVPSLSQPILAEKSTNLSIPRKLEIANLPVLSEQHLQTSVTSLSQPSESQKLVKLNTLNQLQNAEFSGKIVSEKSKGTFSVFSANSNEKGPDIASSKDLGTRRKRRNRSEKSSKKVDMKKVKRTDIQFSSAQIKNMIEIMKIFHTEC